MKLRHIEVFHALMSTGSVTDAANVLHISQPAVSKTLQHAETRLGFSLFERERGRLRPTDEALALYAEVVKLYPQLESVRQLAKNLRRGAGRALRILTLPALAQTVLPRAIAAFRSSYPDCELTVRAAHSRDVITALLLQEADIAFDFGSIAHPLIQRTSLVDIELMCVAPRGWFSEDTPLRADVLAARPVTRLAEGDPLGDRVVETAAALGKPLSRTVTVDTYHAALALATAGVGAALVDSFTAASRNSKEVSVHPLTPPVRFSLCWFTAPNHPPNVMARQLVTYTADAARAMLKQHVA